MKKLAILFVSALMFMGSVAFAAGPLEMFVEGKPGGTTHKRSMIYAEELKKLGYDVTVRQIGSVIEAERLYNEAKGPAVLVTITSSNGTRKQPEILTSQFVQLESTTSYMLCGKSSAPDFNSKDSKIKLGYNNTNPVGVYRLLVKQLPSSVTLVPFGQGSALKAAAMAGEIDYFVLGAGYGAQWMKDGGKCVANTGNREELGVKPIKKVFPSVKEFPSLVLHYYVVAKNVPNMTVFRRDAQTVLQSEEFQKYLAKSKYKLETTDRLDEHRRVMADVFAWTMKE